MAPADRVAKGRWAQPYPSKDEVPKCSLRSWLAVYTRLSSNFSIHTKLTWERQIGVTDIQARNSDNEPLPDADSGIGKYYGANLSKENQFFYLIEFNYHF